MSDYEIIKDCIKSLLEREYKTNGFLQTNYIAKKVNEIKDLTFNEAFAKKLAENDYARMVSEFETMFNVKMDKGIVIQGKEQRVRDTTWWRDKLKIELQQKDKNYYAMKFREFISRKLPPDVVKTLDDDTDSVMNNIGNPNDKDAFDIFGMVVGHVQSGKTMNYSSLICKAADAGYKFIVVIAGDKKNLRNQTQKRINEYFIGKDVSGNHIGVGGSDKNDRGKMPISLTTENGDFNKQDANRNSQGINFDNVATPIVLVIKKNYKTLGNVISWLENQYRNTIQHPMLVIDDEADYASINTNDENDPTKINKLIRTLLNRFEKSSYVAYTATPFANIFINDDSLEKDELSKDLFPRDFIYALDAPSNYFGAEKIFIDNREKYIVEIDDYENKIPLKHKRDLIIDELPPSLYEAINLFCINCAIKHLRGQTSHNSMLVHISRFININHKIYLMIDEYLQKVKNDFKAYGKLEDSIKQSQIIRDFCHLFKNNFGFIKDFSIQDIIYKITEKIDTINVKEAHSKSNNRLEYRNDIPANVIAVGGMALSRGFTLEGLSVSYFIRNTIFYDTLMQMGRWFGYRDNYDDLCRIYMPSEVSDNFTQIIEATNELMERFREMSANGKTPQDFGLEVKYYPDSLLQITARNKMKYAETRQYTINFSGLLKETARIHKDPNILRKNFSVLEDLIINLSSNFNGCGESNYIARDIDKDIILSFLQKFQVVEKYTPLMPIELIKSYAEQKDTAWDIVVYSGRGRVTNIGKINVLREQRQLDDKGKYFEVRQRKVSSGNAEKYALDEESRNKVQETIAIKKRKNELRERETTILFRQALQKPVLMLHILESEIQELAKENIVAFGVCFPYSDSYELRSINYAVNSVKLKEILEENDYDEDNETWGDDDE